MTQYRPFELKIDWVFNTLTQHNGLLKYKALTIVSDELLRCNILDINLGTLVVTVVVSHGTPKSYNLLFSVL